MMNHHVNSKLNYLKKESLEPSLTSGFPYKFIMVGIDGPYMSASNKPTFNWHFLARATATLTGNS